MKKYKNTSTYIKNVLKSFYSTEYTPNEIKSIFTKLDEVFNEINTNKEKEIRFKGLPSVTLEYKNCFYFINNKYICEDSARLILTLFPDILTKKVNVGILWTSIKEELRKEPNGFDHIFNDYKLIAAEIIKDTFAVEQKRLIRKLFRKDFVGYKFF